VDKNGGVTFGSKHPRRFAGIEIKHQINRMFEFNQGKLDGWGGQNPMLDNGGGPRNAGCISVDDVEHVINFENLHILDEHGLVVDNDITEYINLETMNRKLRLRLQQSQKMEAMDQLIGGAARDFNNMLSAIRGCTCLSLGYFSKGNENSRGHLMEVEGFRAQSLVKRILAYTRKIGHSSNRSYPVRILTESLSLSRSIISSSIEIVKRPPQG